MNLKEAFRYQNKLQALMTEIDSLLSVKSHVTTTKCTHMRKKVMAEAEDEIVEEKWDSEFSDRISQLVDFMLCLLGERQLLSAAIRKAKDKLPIDMDGEVSLNAKRQSMVRTLRSMEEIRPSEIVIPGGGRGYRFNAEGNQVSYYCDVKKVTTINFDRKQVRCIIRDLDKQIDSISTQIDQCLVNSVVDYAPRFDVNDTLETAFESFFASIKKEQGEGQPSEE